MNKPGLLNEPKKSILLFVILFGVMFLFGFIENIRGVAYPLLKTEFNTSYEQHGIMISLLGVGYVLFCIIGGILLGRFGVKKALMAGCIFIIAGLVAVFFMPGFWSVAAAMLIVFAGFGLFEVGSNALASQVFTSRTALFMSLLHFFYGAGAAFSPRISGAVSAGLHWRYVYLFSVPLVIIFFITAGFTVFPESKGRTSEGQKIKKAGFSKALTTPAVWAFAVALGFMVVVELSTPNWAGLYFQDVYGTDPKTSGAAFLSNFYILFSVSRLLSGFVIEKAGYFRSLFIASVIVFFIFIAGFSLGAKGIYVLPALGFFVAIFWPTTMASAMRYFKSDAPVMTSAIIGIAGILCGIMQYLTGLIKRLAGPAWGYRSCIVYVLIAVAALAAAFKCVKRPYKNCIETENSA